MNTALQPDVTIAQLAATVNLSSSRFASLLHLFNSQVGVPRARYLRMLRMERARLLLEQTSLPVREVMAHVGISDPSHFTRDFRRFYGLAPTELRKRRCPDEEEKEGTLLAPSEKEGGFDELGPDRRQLEAGQGQGEGTVGPADG